MFSSTILSIAITLVFVYLVVAVMVTGINETWFALSRQRSKQLKKFLSDFFFDDEWRKDIFDRFSNSPFIQVLKKGENKFPAAIPAANFVKAVLTVVGEGKADIKTIRSKVAAKAGKGGLYQLLDSLISQLKTTEELQAQLENIFDTSMERVTGWYKRYARLSSFAVGLAICAALNLDTINIAVRLWNDKALAEKIAAFSGDMSRNFDKDASGKIVFKDGSGNDVTVQMKDTITQTEVTKDTASADSTNMMIPVRTVEKSYEVISESGIPMGWSKQNIPPCTKNPWMGAGLWALKVLGIFLTAFAVTLGAPFWFDLLSRVTPLKKPAGATAAPAPDADQKK